MNTGQRIKKIRLEKNLTLEEIAKKIGVSKATVQRYESGVIANIPQENIEKIAEAMDISPSYLMGWSKHPKLQNLKDMGKTVRIPVVGSIRAGSPTEAIDLEDYDRFEEIFVSDMKGSVCVGLKISGDSMEPKFSDGDVVIIRRQQTCESGDIVAVIIGGLDATIKELKKEREGIRLIPLNPAYSVQYYTNEQIENLPIILYGKVIELRAKFE